MGFYTEKDIEIGKLSEENSRLRGRAYRATHTTPGTHSTACITWGDDGQGNLFNGERVTLGACSCGAWPAWLTRERDEARAKVERLERMWPADAEIRAAKAEAEVARLRAALEHCRELFCEIRSDWSDPRTECRGGVECIDTALAAAKGGE